MERYINKSDAIDALMDANIRLFDGTTSIAGKQYIAESFRNARRAIEDLPDIKPKRRGKWIKITGAMPPEFFGRHMCSLCETCAPYYKWQDEWLSPWCPDCGAKMDVE